MTKLFHLALMCVFISVLNKWETFSLSLNVDVAVMQEIEKTSTTRDHIVSSFASCLSGLRSLFCCACEPIQQSRPCQFISRQHVQHPYVCFAAKAVLWLMLWALFIVCEFGAIFFIVSLICFVWMNTGTKPREPGVPSAYSIFNDNCERIDGTFTSEQFENELRHGAFLALWLTDNWFVWFVIVYIHMSIIVKCYCCNLLDNIKLFYFQWHSNSLCMLYSAQGPRHSGVPTAWL